MTDKQIQPTDENLTVVAGPIVARWLIDAAQQRATLAYGEAKQRLEADEGFGPIGRATRVGLTGGTLMEHFHEFDERLPLLNVLLVLQNGRLPSDGAGPFLAKRFGVPRLANKDFRKMNPAQWRHFSEKAADEVYAFSDWPKIYKRVYGFDWRPSGVFNSTKIGSEKDGIPRGRGGEGPHHEALRLWVKRYPRKVAPSLTVDRSETEADLPSGDRVDVVYYAGSRTIAIEVKSRDSNEADLTRGVFQCVKYLAVLKAMDLRSNSPVSTLLLTETPLPAAVAALAAVLQIKHKCVGLIAS